MGVGHRATGLGLLGAALVVAACSDSTVQECLESGATSYGYSAPGDTTVTFRWPPAYHPVRVYAEPAGNLQANVDAAISLWHGALRCGEVSMQRVADSTIADVVIRNPAQMPPAVSPVQLMADSTDACDGRTDVDLTPGNALIRPLRVYIVPASLTTADVEACYRFVTAHELGHTLGLFSHSSDLNDLMFSRPRRRALSLNDRFTLQVLYHRPAVSIAPEPR